ncbi:hypothetical protein RFI_04240, partial [Reticulomyxa filosa]
MDVNNNNIKRNTTKRKASDDELINEEVKKANSNSQHNDEKKADEIIREHVEKGYDNFFAPTFQLNPKNFDQQHQWNVLSRKVLAHTFSGNFRTLFIHCAKKVNNDQKQKNKKSDADKILSLRRELAIFYHRNNGNIDGNPKKRKLSENDDISDISAKKRRTNEQSSQVQVAAKHEVNEKKKEEQITFENMWKFKPRIRHDVLCSSKPKILSQRHRSRKDADEISSLKYEIEEMKAAFKEITTLVQSFKAMMQMGVGNRSRDEVNISNNGIIDITLCTSSILPFVSNWRTDETLDKAVESWTKCVDAGEAKLVSGRYGKATSHGGVI